MSKQDLPDVRILDSSLEELYEHLPCGYVSTTTDGHIVRVNQTFTDLIGMSRETLTSGKRLPDLLTTGGRIFYETHLVPMLTVRREVNEIALDFHRADQTILPALVTAVQKQDPVAKVLLTRMTVFKATERRRYEQELLLTRQHAEQVATELARVNAELSQSNTALLKANEDLGQFAYAASHDLQEPLRAMTIYAQLLARGYRDVLDERAHEFLANIVEGSSRMQALIRDLLAFSQAQGTELVLRPTESSQVLKAALTNLQSSIQESNAVITSDALPAVTVDAARIAQVFQNLVGNAIKYRKPDQAPRIHVSAHGKAGDTWTFSVQDNGLGFDPVYADQIFGMFKRLHSREISGTGIGLAICRKIVELHGGIIWASSVPGSGSQFVFTIPDRQTS